MVTVLTEKGATSIKNIEEHEYEMLGRALEFYRRHLEYRLKNLDVLDAVRLAAQGELSVVDDFKEALP